MQLAAEYTAGKIVRALLDGFDTTLTGKAKTLHPATCVVAALFLVKFAYF